MPLSWTRWPQPLSSTDPAPSAELLRVVIEGGGYVGFVEVAPDTSLADVRLLIARGLDVDTVPAHYQFVWPDGMLVGSVSERGALARDFLPCITLMPTTESPVAGAYGGTLPAADATRSCGHRLGGRARARHT